MTNTPLARSNFLNHSSFSAACPPFRLARLALLGALLPLSALANESLSTVGYGLTVGPVFNRSNLSSANYNPANSLRLVGDDEKLRFGVISVGSRYEIGDLNDVVKMKDSIKADVDAANQLNDADNAKALAQKITNVYLPALDAGARLSVQGQLSVLSPVLLRTELGLPGVWTVSAAVHGQTSGIFRSSEVGVLVKVKSTDAAINNTKVEVPLLDLTSQLQELQAAALNGTPAEQQAALEKLQTLVVNNVDAATLDNIIESTKAGNTITTTFAARTASAFDFKAAEVNQISLGYAHDLTRFAPEALSSFLPKGRLDVGFRLNAYQANLYRQVMALVDEEGRANTINLRSNKNLSRGVTQLGVDLGARWSDANYQLGVAVYNLNSPRFTYPSLANDPNAANRYATQTLSDLGKITLSDDVVLKPHTVLEGSLYTTDKRWLFQASGAVNPTNDFVGNPQQMVTLSASFNAERFEAEWMNYLVPGFRAGFRQNLVGTKLSTVGLGVSWGIFNMDLNFSTQNVKADGKTVPRSAGIAFSVAEKF